MENKKLLKYLLKDLSELDEMFAEEGKESFDDIEIEFIKSRVSGAKRLVKLFLDHENEIPAEIKSIKPPQKKAEINKSELIKEKEESKKEAEIQQKEQEVKTAKESLKSASEVVVEENVEEIIVEEKLQEVAAEVIDEVIIEEKEQVIENINVAPKSASVEDIIIEERPLEKAKEEIVNSKQDKKDLQLEDEEPVDIKNKRLGDSFSKEKSVNDLMSADLSKLEHKLSNRPVNSIKSSIGINDKFQYIRELFEGSTDDFVKTVGDLDSMNDLKEAVDYLQDNFKWKKNETSLKFVNLIKRRFLNE